MQPPIDRKCFMTPDAIHRYADQMCAGLCKSRKDLIVECHLIATDWAPVCRVEGENDGRTFKLGQ